MIMEIGIWITFIIINAVIEAFSMGVTNLWLACGGESGRSIYSCDAGPCCT